MPRGTLSWHGARYGCHLGWMWIRPLVTKHGRMDVFRLRVSREIRQVDRRRALRRMSVRGRGTKINNLLDQTQFLGRTETKRNYCANFGVSQVEKKCSKNHKSPSPGSNSKFTKFTLFLQALLTSVSELLVKDRSNPLLWHSIRLGKFLWNVADRPPQATEDGTAKLSCIYSYNDSLKKVPRWSSDWCVVENT